MKIGIKSLMLVLTVGMASCTSDEGKSLEDINPIPTTDTIELTDAEKTANANANVAAFKMLNMMAQNYELIKNPNDNTENITFSPLSMSISLSMTASSMRNSQDGICDLLGSENIGQLNTLNNKLMRYLSSTGTGATLNLANSIWYSDKYTLSKDYTQDIQSTYYAETNPTDFTTPACVDIINSWVCNKTNGMINNIMSTNNPNMDVMIINAMYFSGRWDKDFDSKDTSKRKFAGTNGDKDIDMMYGTRPIKYRLTDNYEIGVFEFKGPTTLTIAIPQHESALEAAKSITAEDLAADEYISDFLVYLPKFKIGHQWSLSKLFEMLGINLSGNLGLMGINEYTELGAVQQTAFNLDEEGAKAAAVSQGNFSHATGIAGLFNVNRPFLFFIRNTVTGTIIMCGCINNL